MKTCELFVPWWLENGVLAAFLMFLSRWKKFKLSWPFFLDLMKKFEIYFPRWLEHGVTVP